MSEADIQDLRTRLEAAEKEAAKVKDLEERLAKAEKGDGTVATTNPSRSLVSTSAGKTWKGGAKFQGGPQHYAMATDAFSMALECKDRGDSRSFSMIFDQIFMEQRRTVGVGKDATSEYDSARLIRTVFDQAKKLQDEDEDDRPFGLIFADLSMRHRRTHKKKKKTAAPATAAAPAAAPATSAAPA